jgi:hypothetical protein
MKAFAYSLLKLVRSRKKIAQGSTRWVPRPFLALENLEDRTLLSISAPTAGTPGPVTITGSAQADRFVIRLNHDDANTIEFSDDHGATFTAAALADVNGITVNGLAGNDELVIDNSNGLVAKKGGLAITYDGGPGADALTLAGKPGGADVNETFTPGATSDAATLKSDNGSVSQTISFVGLSFVNDTMQAASLTINANDKQNMIKILNGPALGNLKTTKVVSMDRHAVDQGADDPNDNLDSGAADSPANGSQEAAKGNSAAHPKRDEGFVPVLFANKSSVTVNALGGDDFIFLNNPNPATGLSKLTVDGGDGFDALAVRNAPPGVTLITTNIERSDADPDTMFIEQLYQQRLNRAAADNEVASWKAVLHGPAGQAGVAQGIEQSPEARTQLVQNWYQKYLGRQAQGGEEQAWVQQLLQGQSEENVLSSILASPEFSNRANTMTDSGTSDAKFIQGLYNVLLSRVANSDELQGWLNTLPKAGHQAVATAFLHSQEFRTDLITALYSNLLNRDSDQPGLQSWALSNSDLTHLRQAFESSQEFFNHS